MEKNTLPSEVTIIEHELSKNKSVFAVDCFLHPQDMEDLADVIFDYVKTKCQKSEDFSKKFNTEIDAVQKELIMRTFIFQATIQFNSEHDHPTICGDRVKWLEIFQTKSLFYKRAESKAWKYYLSKYPEYKGFIQLA